MTLYLCPTSPGWKSRNMLQEHMQSLARQLQDTSAPVCTPGHSCALQHARGTLGTRAWGVLWHQVSAETLLGSQRCCGAGGGAGNKKEHPSVPYWLKDPTCDTHAVLLQRLGVLVCWLHFCQHLHRISRKAALKRCKAALPYDKRRFDSRCWYCCHFFLEWGLGKKHCFFLFLIIIKESIPISSPM